ncbi:MAG TPA: guanylate kinase [Thermoanaerobaculia bacterium]|jgi:guanylate kinase|nr:guanylate kinase [Thermoanaerobaculia bacterium]
MHRGDLYILSAPSGAGKTTLINSILEGPVGRCGELVFSVSHTTRKPRRGEVPDREYHFVDHATFQRMIANEAFLEWAEVHNNYYGTALDEVFPRLERGVDVLMDIDVQGAERVLARYPEASSIFIMPPSFGDLKKRLHQRGLDGPGEIAQRLAVSMWEIKRYHQYQHVIINDDAERASQALAAIILERRYRRDRMDDAVKAVLRDFQAAALEGEPATGGTPAGGS